MKRIISIAICALTIAAVLPAAAQQRERRQQENTQRSPEEMAKARADMWKEQLNLDEGQYDKVLELCREQVKNRPAMREDGKRPSEEEMAKMREEMSAAREKYKADMKEILTDEQYAKFEESMKNAPMMNGNRGGGRPAPPAPQND